MNERADEIVRTLEEAAQAVAVVRPNVIGLCDNFWQSDEPAQLGIHVLAEELEILAMRVPPRRLSQVQVDRNQYRLRFHWSNHVSFFALSNEPLEVFKSRIHTQVSGSSHERVAGS